MQIKKLPQKDRKALDLAYRSSKDPKVQRRIQVIRLLSKRYSHRSVSDITGYGDAHIRNLVTQYNKQGIKGLEIRPITAKRQYLNQARKEKIKEILQNKHIPSEAGLKVREDQNYWSIETLKQLIKEKYKVTYKSKTSYREIMKYCGMSYLPDK